MILFSYPNFFEELLLSTESSMSLSSFPENIESCRSSVSWISSLVSGYERFKFQEIYEILSTAPVCNSNQIQPTSHLIYMSIELLFVDNDVNKPFESTHRRNLILNPNISEYAWATIFLHWYPLCSFKDLDIWNTFNRSLWFLQDKGQRKVNGVLIHLN